MVTEATPILIININRCCWTRNGHAVCEKNSKFSLPKESGAMNEAFLIFGAHVSNITQHQGNLLG
jgi:hypothetical protein